MGVGLIVVAPIPTLTLPLKGRENIFEVGCSCFQRRSLSSESARPIEKSRVAGWNACLFPRIM